MRSERVIANEIEVTRANLEHDLSQLRSLVDDKLDIVKRARSKLDTRRRQAIEARDVMRANIAQNPLIAVGAAFAAGALFGLLRSR